MTGEMRGGPGFAVPTARRLLVFGRLVLFFMCVLCGAHGSQGEENRSAVIPSGVTPLKASANPPDQTTYNSDMQPLTADEFWHKFKLLIEKQRGYITQDMFDELFNIRLTQTYRGDDGEIYNIKIENGRYFEAKLLEASERFRMPPGFGWDGQHSSLRLILRDPFPPLNSSAGLDWCLPLSQTIADIRALGWGRVMGPITDRWPFFYKLWREDKNAEVIVHYAPNNVKDSCVYELIVTSYP